MLFDELSTYDTTVGIVLRDVHAALLRERFLAVILAVFYIANRDLREWSGRRFPAERLRRGTRQPKDARVQSVTARAVREQ